MNVTSSTFDDLKSFLQIVISNGHNVSEHDGGASRHSSLARWRKKQAKGKSTVGEEVRPDPTSEQGYSRVPFLLDEWIQYISQNIVQDPVLEHRRLEYSELDWACTHLDRWWYPAHRSHRARVSLGSSSLRRDSFGLSTSPSRDAVESETFHRPCSPLEWYYRSDEKRTSINTRWIQRKLSHLSIRCLLSRGN